MNTELDEQDRRLLLALQEMPLRPWNHIAAVLSMARGEPQKRWRRLQAELGARIVLDHTTATFGAPHIILDIHAEPGREWEVAERLAHLPAAEYVFLQSGQDNVVAHLTPEAGSLRVIQKTLGEIEGLGSYRVTFATGTLRRFRHWQLQPASEEEAELVTQARASYYAQTKLSPSGASENINSVAGDALVEMLRRDARVSIESLNVAENQARSDAGIAPVSEITTRRTRDLILSDPARRVSLRIRQRPWNYPLHAITFEYDHHKRAELFAALQSSREHIVYAVETTGERNIRVLVSCETAAELEDVRGRIAEFGASRMVVERIHAAGFGAARVRHETIALRAVGSEKR